MQQSIVFILLAAAVGALAGFVGSTFNKPTPLQPHTTVISGGAIAAGHSKSLDRALAAAWGDLDQKEVDAITAELKKLQKSEMVIFCKDDPKCGDMGLDLENAFESAHWTVRQEAPLIDDTVGVATSREDVRDALNRATGGRLNVGLIQKNAPWDVVAIGKKARTVSGLESKR